MALVKLIKLSYLLNLFNISSNKSGYLNLDPKMVLSAIFFKAKFQPNIAGIFIHSRLFLESVFHS